MPFVSEAQRRKFYELARRGEISEETVRRWEEHTPKGVTLPERLHAKTAFDHGACDALEVYGLKEAGVASTLGRWGGKALQWGGKALGFLPTGIGNAAGAVLGGAGGIMEGLANGQGFRGALAHGVRGAASGAMPFGTGLAFDAAATPMLNGALNKRRPPMPNAIGQV